MDSQEQHISYKPSRQFLIRGSITVAVIALVLIFQTNWFWNLFNKKQEVQQVASSNETIGNLLTKDTNGNTIPDWEEKLWGLDPNVLYTNGISNKQIIEQKKKDLGVTDTKESPLNETDILAQQLFSITSAISQSDQNGDGTLANVGTDLGNSVKFKQVTNRYSIENIKTTKTTTSSLNAYYNAVTKITGQYKSEIAATDILAPALETGDFTDLPKLKETAQQYKNFSKSLQTITVPTGIAQQHLALINGFYGMAQSFDYILQIEDNGVNALAGVAIYNNYASRVNQALTDLNDYFVNYGILNE